MQCRLCNMKLHHIHEEYVHVLVQPVHLLYEDDVVDIYNLIVIEMIISLVVKVHGDIFKS